MQTALEVATLIMVIITIFYILGYSPGWMVVSWMVLLFAWVVLGKESV
jgi:uncharacterized membrane protein YGL010W